MDELITDQEINSAQPSLGPFLHAAAGLLPSNDNNQEGQVARSSMLSQNFFWTLYGELSYNRKRGAMLMNDERRTERIEARTTPAIRKLMEQAAMLEGRSLSDFVISIASQAAKRTIEEFNTIQLSSRDQQAFAKSLLSPKPVPKALKRAKQRHTDLLGPS